MYLFGGKFCKFVDDFGNERECTCPEIIAQHPWCECDRKHFNNILWATVTVFQILTQEDWNVVLFNGMEKTSHWAALYFVALMTFGNYVLFNLLVAILVEGFSSERNERREREQRELAKSKLSGECFSDNNEMSYEESHSASHSSDSFTQNEIKNSWRSADDIRKCKDSNGHRDNLQKQKLLKHAGDSDKIVEKKIFYNNKKHNKATCFLDCPEDSKCNIQKESKMLQSSAACVPVITHTAATPQDSPNTTLEPGASFKEFKYGSSLSHSSLLDSLDSIDRTSCRSIPGLLKPPNPNTLGVHTGVMGTIVTPPPPTADKACLPPVKFYNEDNGNKLGTSLEKVGQTEKYFQSHYDKNIQLSKSSLLKADLFCSNNNNCISTSDKSSLLLDDKSDSGPELKLNESKCKVQRGYSWKISRPSLRKKYYNTKHRSGSDSDAIIILNNGRDHANCLGTNIRESIRKNDLLPPSTNIIKNDTHSDTPNNKLTQRISPQNSLKGISPPSSVKIEGIPAKATLPEGPWVTAHQKQLTFHPHSLSTAKVLTGEVPINSRQLNELTVPKSSNIINSSLTTCGKEKRSNSNIGPLPDVTKNKEEMLPINGNNNNNNGSIISTQDSGFKIKHLFRFMEPTGCLKDKEDFSLYIFPAKNRVRAFCVWFVNRKWFDNVILLFIALNCITLAMERPNIPPYSKERAFLGTANYVFTVVFAIEMFVKVVASGMFYGPHAYFTSGWNIMDGSLVIISIIDLLMSLISESSPRIFGILRVFRLLRSLRPLRVINRAPGLKLVVQTLLSSLRPIGNIVLICCTFFIIFGILGVQLFKGAFFYCEGEHIKGVKNKTECLAIKGNVWINRKYNFDDLGKALMSLFVLSSRDGWVNIMYTGLDAVGVDQQPIVNYSEWRLLYFIAFILLVGFFVLNMFVGVVVENFHRCREEQEKEERVRRAAKRALQMEKKRRKMHRPPYYSQYSPTRLFVHNVVTSKYFDLAIAGVIGLNVVSMAIEYYRMPPALEYTLKIFNYFFTAVFILEAIMKLVALGFKIYLKDKWNQLDVIIVILSIVGIVLEELQSNIIPINPTIMRVMRVLRIARVLKLLKMAKGIRALLDTVMQALPQVGNLGLLFFLLFFIFAALGVELFGRLECSEEKPCQGLGEHAHFANFGMAFLTLFRVATGDNWNGIMKDTLREDCDSAVDCVRNCCVSTVIAPIFFVIFVLMAQFVLVNVVVAVLMKHLEESHKQMEDEMDMEVELERELEREQDDEEDKALCLALEYNVEIKPARRPLTKVLSLPANFTYTAPSGRNSIQLYPMICPTLPLSPFTPASAASRRHGQRRQTLHSQHALLPHLAGVSPHVNFPARYNVKGRRTSCASMLSSRRMSADRYSVSSRGYLSRESSTESAYHSRKLRKRMDSTGSDRIPYDKTSTNVLYEEDTCFIDAEDSEEVGMNLKVKDTRISECPPIPQVDTFTVSIPSHVSTENLLHPETVPPRQMSLDESGILDSLQKLTTKDKQSKPNGGSFLTVPKNTRPVHKLYGSSKHLFKQPAVDFETFEEATLLLPECNSSKGTSSSLSVRGTQNTTFCLSPNISIAEEGISEYKNIGEMSTQASQRELSEVIANTSGDSAHPTSVPVRVITVTDSDFDSVNISEQQKIRNVIAERRKVDTMKTAYDSFCTPPPTLDTKILMDSRTQSIDEEGSSGIMSMQSQERNNRHLSIDRMSTTNFSTSGESGDLLLGQRSSESYDETSEEQGIASNSTSTAVADKMCSGAVPPEHSDDARVVCELSDIII